jgi:hypothetical protein
MVGSALMVLLCAQLIDQSSQSAQTSRIDSQAAGASGAFLPIDDAGVYVSDSGLEDFEVHSQPVAFTNDIDFIDPSVPSAVEPSGLIPARSASEVNPLELNQVEEYSLITENEYERQQQSYDESNIRNRELIRDRIRARLVRLRSRVGRRYAFDQGLGFERVRFAPMILETAMNNPSVGIRFKNDFGLNTPDRLEYVWARAGRGPAAEQRVDIFDSVLRMEVGNASAVAITEYTMRSLNPDINPNTVGFGDMVVGAKANIYDNGCTQVSSAFRTYLKTGPVDRGLGTGHVSLEPGILACHQLSQFTYLHGELKYWLPIAGTNGFAGDVLQSGLGISTLWRDYDDFALMPTFEVQSHTFLFGSQTNSIGPREDVDSLTVVGFYPGLRIAKHRSRIGLVEVGFAAGFSAGDRDWFDQRLLLDLRWVR